MRAPNPKIDPVKALSDWQLEAAEYTPETWRDYHCKLVTPLYGGGVRAGEVDAEMPIRAAGIRGQLRFWWRLSCGPFASSEAMFKREAAIWGGLGSGEPLASKVSVRVESVNQLHKEPAFTYQQDRNNAHRYRTMPKAEDWIEPYAVFPARGELNEDKTSIEIEPHELAQAGLSFRLKIGLHPELTDEQRTEVETALRWWGSFGGVGARTRRGLGAVEVRGLERVTPDEVEAKGGQLVLRKKAEKNAVDAWKESVKRLNLFRQGEGVGRNPRQPDSKTPGRSRWPEPDMIRRHTLHNSPKHPPQHPIHDVYPRAAFGLPIIFHFKDERQGDQRQGDPQQQQLIPQDRDRMASPLILRPYKDGENWYPAALLIPGWEKALEVVAEHGAGTENRVWWEKSTDDRAQHAAQIKPMAGRGNDPLSAFMTYFQED